MNSFSKFVINYRLWIPWESVYAIQVISEIPNEDEESSLDITFFKNDEEMIGYISKELALYIYQKHEKSLKDLKPTLPNIDLLYRAWEPKIMERFHFFEHVDLSLIGLNKIVVPCVSCEDETGYSYDENEFLIINLCDLTNYDRMIIENYIWNMCVDAVVVLLKQKTTFNIEKRYIDGVSSYALMSSGKISQIHSSYQLQMYVERHHFKDLFLIDGYLLESDIIIPRALIQLSIDDLPRYVSFNVVLWKINGDINYVNPKDFYQLESIRFQIIINADMSISLVPHPKDLEMIIHKQIKILDNCNAFTHHNHHIVVPEKFFALFDYLHKNQIKTIFGEIDRILDDSETYQIKKELGVFNIRRIDIRLTTWWGAKYIRLKN